MRIHGTTFRPVEQLHVVREHRGSDRSLVLYHLLQRHPRSELFHRQRRTLPRVVARRGARMGGRSPVPARLLLFLPDAALRSGCPFGRGCRRFQRPRASRARPQSVGRMRGLGGGGVPQSRGRSAAYAAGFLFVAANGAGPNQRSGEPYRRGRGIWCCSMRPVPCSTAIRCTGT